MQSYTQETNNRLYYAQCLLHCRDSGANGREQQALDYAGWLCLQAVWKAWLQELADNAGMAPGSMCNYSSLMDSTLKQNAVVQHLINLKATPHSWLNHLLKRIEHDDVKTETVQAARDSARPIAPEGLSLKQLDDEQSITESECLLQVLAGLKDHIQFTREQQLEW